MTDSSTPVDGERMLREAAELSFPRYPGTEGDARAIAWVKDRLAEAGLEVVEEPFAYDVRPAWRALAALLTGSAVLVGLAGWLAPARPGAAGLLLAAAVLPAAVFLAWAPWLERIYRQDGPTHTANVCGRRPSVGSPRMTLVCLAHHDSKSQSLTFPWRMGLTLLALGAVLALAGLVVAVAIGGGSPGPPWLPRVLGGAGAVALLVLATMRSGNRSPGGVDNAGSVAIVLELARLLPAELPDDVELLFLSPGAEEDHMVGAMRWLDAHAEDLRRRPTYGLNFDGAGAPGRPVLIERFGFGRSFAPRAAAAARAAAGELEIPARRILLPPAQGVDAIPFVHRGIECLTFASGSLDRATMSVHSAADRPEHLDRPTLETVTRLARATARALSQSPQIQS